MKSPLLRAFFLLAAQASFCSLLHAQDSPLPCAPVSVTLTGVLFEEGYGDDPPSPRYRDYKAWILRLDQPVSIQGLSDEKSDVAKGVKEIQLNVDHDKHPLPKGAFGKKRFVVTGTLYRPGTSYFLRPVAMSVTNLHPEGSR